MPGSIPIEDTDTQDASVLFQPLQVGAITLQHRLVLAPMVRFRNDSNGVPLLPCVAEYYRQRASSMPGGLLITEATVIAPQAGGSEHVAGIWSDAQVFAWKEVTDAVHRHGGFIFMQLWALGRVANPKIIARQGFDYVAPSAVPVEGKSQAPRPLTVAEIQEYPALYGSAASNAVHRAGFDGVEIHGANGHLIDQFLQDISNKRTDKYGGSLENRTRFALEVVQAVVDAVGEDRVGYRISPWDTSHGMRMVDPMPQFDHLVYELETRFPKLAYLHVVEPRVTGEATRDPNDIDHLVEGNEFLRDVWGERPYIASGGVNRKIAIETVTEHGGLVAMGRLFLANPDLPLRWQKNKTLNQYDRSTFYLPGDATGQGLTDYPFVDGTM